MRGGWSHVYNPLWRLPSLPIIVAFCPKNIDRVGPNFLPDWFLPIHITPWIWGSCPCLTHLLPAHGHSSKLAGVHFVISTCGNSQKYPPSPLSSDHTAGQLWQGRGGWTRPVVGQGEGVMPSEGEPGRHQGGADAPLFPNGNRRFDSPPLYSNSNLLTHSHRQTARIDKLTDGPSLHATSNDP